MMSRAGVAAAGRERDGFEEAGDTATAVFAFVCLVIKLAGA